ncbi:hypothetical protein QTH97_20720 [Variovorax sp. J22R24]|uniref:hypothetical protein n=1 Tax=Variovorax gracilis TaxID=3053502 RepID=UPI002577375A|nr:hypothetical protein [Variovorax sp. J22R24]MDM0107382.1 hypothetical protein [Variovorax sp. J22R24]
MKRMIIRVGLPLVAALVVVACGGGGGGGGYFPPIGGGTTPTDTDTLDAFLAYVKSLVATALDTAEPADVTAFDPSTTTETREPFATQ